MMIVNKKPLSYIFLIVSLWTFIVGGSLIWNILDEKESMKSLAKKDAISNFNKNMAFRSWAVRHGGVYVKVDERTPPNPNLSHIPERDVVTHSGTKLTLMNSAYMLRQMMSEYPKGYGLHERLVSDKPLWKPNAPDQWEAEAIEGFKKGHAEKLEFTTYQGEPYLRFMGPLYIEQGCLKCHAIQGYKVGDVRGGIGVMLRMEPYLDDYEKSTIRLSVSHAIIYGVGLFLILVGGRSLSCYLEEIRAGERKAQTLSEELEVKVIERTSELETTNEQLQEANKQLKELDQLKSMFIASMSHELRTPLNTIIGFTGITLEGMSGDINDKQRDNLNRVKLAGQHLLSLISDVIDISKIEAGRVEAAVETFSLRELIRKSKEEIEAVATPKGLSVGIEMGEDIQMQSDRRRLYQCLLNFLSNAVKFTDQSGTILIRVEDAGEKVKISITDNGIGIAQEDQAKLFEAFERVETHMRVKPGGTGLGLYLTRKIAEELLEGSVWVESTAGKGSIFGLTIPKTLHKKIEKKEE